MNRQVIEHAFWLQKDSQSDLTRNSLSAFKVCVFFQPLPIHAELGVVKIWIVKTAENSTIESTISYDNFIPFIYFVWICPNMYH